MRATKNVCYTALAVALICVCSWIAIPLGTVPVTLQSLAVFVTAALLGIRRSFFAVIAYMVLGFIGIPVFAGFTGGIAKLLTPTGGYLLGFLLVTPLVAWLLARKKHSFWHKTLIFSLATLILYACGVFWLVLVAETTTKIGLWSALLVCVIPYILPDICKIVLAATISQKLQGKI